MNGLALILLAVCLDWIFGDPYNIPHPIVYVGKLISFLEKNIRKLNISLKLGGYLLCFLTVGIIFSMITLGLFIAGLFHPIAKDVVTVYFLYTALAAKSMNDEVMKVYLALAKKDILESRKYISYLVGRDTQKLNEQEITRAAVETVAENTVDGVLAPLFYMLIGLFFNMPLQFAFIYKAVNTLDSMVGYIQEPYREIGYCSAKADDILNYIPARLGSIFMLIGGALLGYNYKNGVRILKRDCRNHKSPNCGFPESAVAGLLGIQLGGTNRYFNEVLVKPTIGDKLKKLDFRHIIDAVKILYASEAVMLLMSIPLIGLLLYGN